MGRRVLISFLGITEYAKCNYKFKEERIENVRFVTEAIAKIHCKDWEKEDSIMVFATQKAKEKNWTSIDGKSDRYDIPYIGLEERLEDLKFKCQISPIDIMEGKSEEEIWNIFDTIFEKLKDDDEVIFDITLGFRSLPMLAITILNYSTVMKKIKIRGVYYGAYDAKKKDLSENKEYVPIFDLKAFAKLLDWTSGIESFIKYGDARAISLLAKDDINPVLKEESNIKAYGVEKQENAMVEFGEELENLTEAIHTCRGQVLTKTFDFDKLNILLGQVDKRAIKPLKPLIDKITKKVADFKNDDIQNGYNAVKWCIDHGLTQQGFTILQETIRRDMLIQGREDIDLSEKQVRDIFVETCVAKDKAYATEYELLTRVKGKVFKLTVNDLLQNEDDRKRKLDEKLSNISKEEINKVEKAINYLIQEKNSEILKTYTALSKARNDINHAGFNKETKSAKELRANLKEHYKKIKEEDENV